MLPCVLGCACILMHACMLTHTGPQTVRPGNTKMGSITVLLTSCLTGLELVVSTDNFCFYLQNRLSQTSQTAGQWYSDTSPFSIPWSDIFQSKAFTTGISERLTEQWPIPLT